MEGQEVGPQRIPGGETNNSNSSRQHWAGQVGVNSAQNTIGEQTYFGGATSAKAFSDPAKKKLAPLGKDERELLSLLWPNNLIRELSGTKDQTSWATPLMIINFVLATILALVLGPIQLLILSFSNDYVFTTEVFFPTALRVSMILSGVITLSTVVALVQTWREQAKHSLSNIMLGLGVGLISILIWLSAFGLKFRPYQLAILLCIGVLLPLILAVSLRGKVYATEQRHLALHGLMAITISLVAVETIFDATFLVMDIVGKEKVQSEIEQIGIAQKAARVEGVPDGLSDLAFTLCGGAYSSVYQSEELPDTGIFECKDSHDVYVASGPLEAQAEYKTNSVVTGSAFYAGTTDNALVSQFFPVDTGIHYLYRELKDRDEPSELVLLVPAANEQELVAKIIDPLTGLINAHASQAQNQPLRVSIFYNSELNSVYSTRDFVIMAAADTIALNDYLPNGNSLTGYVNGRSGTYIYRPDSELKILADLGVKPLLYSAQTRNAITANRHITIVAEAGREYSIDEVVNMLYYGFFDPFSNPDQLENAAG